MHFSEEHLPAGHRTQHNSDGSNATRQERKNELFSHLKKKKNPKSDLNNTRDISDSI